MVAAEDVCIVSTISKNKNKKSHGISEISLSFAAMYSDLLLSILSLEAWFSKEL
jgi:hypothetical protein